MALRRKGSAPWSLTKDTGLSDAPVSGYPFVEGDEVKPVIDAGFIDADGLWQIDKTSDDRQFTFQDPNQAMAAGVEVSIEGIDMSKHDILIVASVDASGNNVPLTFSYNNAIAGINEGPYTAAIFSSTGVREPVMWKVNEYPGTGGVSGDLDEIVRTGDVTQYTKWQFFKLIGMRGTVGKLLIINTHGSNAGTISTAYLRLV